VRRTIKIRAGLVGTAVAIGGVASGCVYNTPPVGAASGFGDVATIAKNDVWAVGSTATSFSSPSKALIEHFDGTSWRIAAIPAASGTSLTSVTAVSATDVWAVGNGHTLHWDGHTWTATADPAQLQISRVEHGHGGLVMALGFNTSTSKPEVLTRTANTWQPIATPTPPLPTTARACDDVVQVRALTLLTTSDIWVVGGTVNSGANVTSGCPYAAHWDGSSWTTFSPPNPVGGAVSALVAVSERADGTVWSVGQAQSDPSSSPGFAVRWNHSAWQSLCNFGCGPITWTDIDATGTSVWASGTQILPNNGGDLMGISRWVGNGWQGQSVQRIIPAGTPIPGNILTSVSVRGGAVTTAGFYFGLNPTTHTTTSTPLVDVRSDG
jgi:hypothetical protein